MKKNAGETMSAGQVAAAAVAALRERTSLPALQAVQLLRATNGVVDSAVELYLAAPDMFADSQATLLQQAADMPIGTQVAAEPAHAPEPAAVPAVPSRSVHSRSATAKKLRQRKRKEKQKQKTVSTAAADTDGGSFSFARRQQLERAAFERGVMAEKANAKQRRGARQASKKIDKQHRRAEQRMGRRRRAAQV